jgi:hypothetical protein
MERERAATAAEESAHEAFRDAQADAEERYRRDAAGS